MSTGVTIGLEGLERIIQTVLARGYRPIGPVVKDGAITTGEISGVADLPQGWHDVQAPGEYSLHNDGSRMLFDWAVGPASAKPEVFPPQATIWRARPPAYEVEEVPDDPPPTALIGARPCDVAALTVLDGVLDGKTANDPAYRRRRSRSLVVAVECTHPAATCFCTSMGTGPAIANGFDIALTEIPPDDAEGEPLYVARPGSSEGREILATVPHRDTTAAETEARVALIARAASRMGRAVDTGGLPELMARNLSNPRWEQVAQRCLACGNCTSVCPTCFCSNFQDITGLDGTVERQRTWASCSDLAYSYVHGGPVRASIKSRYRQWAMHKFSWWWDQFSTSGCVGCGRCITWCPARIDITEEIAALRASDGASTHIGG